MWYAKHGDLELTNFKWAICMASMQ